MGINSYSFAVEQLEDMVLTMIDTGEPLHKARAVAAQQEDATDRGSA
jgi:hypothetical protein